MIRRLLCIFLMTCGWGFAAAPEPLPQHPGNIFVEGEEVSLPPATQPVRFFDYDGKEVHLPARLPIGYYEARPERGPRTTFAVIAPLKARPGKDSPISIDVAMAWFYPTPAEQEAVTNLCQLAGINWVRDRLSWPVMEPQRGAFAAKNIYDDTARLQSQAGLQVLQVSHISPPWANPDARRFPPDLRDVYNYNKAMAARWKGKVAAIEPWNEADIDVFGGHTGSEMASMQKAAYLGLKAGNPDVIACQNVFAIARQSTLDDFAANDATACFDTYNLHHYVPFEQYPQVYAAHRAVSGGKPMWVTECNVPVQWADEATKEPADEQLRRQANRVAKVYAMSLHEGSANTFYFILGDYVERQTQFGIIHKDLTPRPAYVALAAAGRLLADAKPLGRWKHADPTVHGYLFRARPDGEEKNVLVAWRQAQGDVDAQLNAPVEKVIDHLGRTRTGTWSGNLKLTGAPLYAILPANIPPQIELDPPPAKPALNTAKPASVVLQAVIPPEAIDLNRSAYVMPPDKEHLISVYAYNFGPELASADVHQESSPGLLWQCDIGVEVHPNGREKIELTLLPRAASDEIKTIKLRWKDATLSLRIVDAKQEK